MAENPYEENRAFIVQPHFEMNDQPSDHTHGISDSATDSRHFDSFSQAIGAARRDASFKAREAAPKLKKALAGAAHDVAYGAAFGACFAACFAKELVPARLRESLKRGAKAGREAAEGATAEAPPLAVPAG